MNRVRRSIQFKPIYALRVRFTLGVKNFIYTQIESPEKIITIYIYTVNGALPALNSVLKL